MDLGKFNDLQQKLPILSSAHAYRNIKVPINLKKLSSLKNFERFIHDQDEVVKDYDSIPNWPVEGGNDDITTIK